MPPKVELIPIRVPMTEPFRISSGSVDTKESILVRIEDDGLIAWGEASPMSGAFYSIDTPESTLAFLREEAIPRWESAGHPGPAFVSEQLQDSEGNRFAWAGFEGALWDFRLQREGRSFSDEFGGETKPIESGLAVGIYPTIEKLVERCHHYLMEGYKRLKIKIEPGWDVEPLKAIRSEFPTLPLMVDANAAYRREHFSLLEALDEFDLMMIEQPLAAEDLKGHADLQSRIGTPICLDESAESPARVRKAIELGSCRIVNIKIQRVGGLSAAKAIHDLCAQEGIANWMGTMPELGIASLHALYMATLPNCLYPTDVESSARWFQEDIVEPPIEVKGGMIQLPPEHTKRPMVDEERVERWRMA
ncbi:MAG: o-succinylbenzoate synthase [Candidatus Omnitrophica bacterium]|nr:o-succinylbenzoate synthase [Candidatus Omnitrophota bacterium]